ncbi:putative urea active transporter 1 [Taenia crassiceps]|uniref:Urea active transporter 1 n=1 Tax=Taenia crassiceps TaxID=6207 RepID=A0ABR4QDR5_9CEST
MGKKTAQATRKREKESTKFWDCYNRVGHVFHGRFFTHSQQPFGRAGILITQFRTRAPGAETFPQLMLARFGKRVHLLFCFFTILNNISIVAAVVSTGCGFYSVISQNVTFELAWIITVIVSEICATAGNMSHLLPFSSVMFIYLLIMTLVITIKVFFYDETGLLGSIERVYNATHDADNFHEKDGNVRLTMRNYFSLESGLCKCLAQIVELIFDQALWETCSFFTPGQESWGIMATTLIWCAFPLVFGSSCGFGSLALNANNEAFTPERSSTVEIAKRLLGPNGLFTLFSLYAFVVTTATLLQIISITKILTFDIYAVHLRPFRVCYEVNCCIFCGKSKGEKTRPKDKCRCCDPADCLQCQEDLKSVTTENCDPLPSRCSSIVSNFFWVINLLSSYFQWIIIELILSEFPTHCIVGGLGSAILALFWSKLTESAVLIGTLTSSTLSIATRIAFFELKNHESSLLSDDQIDLVSNGTGIVCGFILPVIIALASKERETEQSDAERADLTWQRTLDLGSPVNPWTRTYSQTFNLPLSKSGLLTGEQVMKAMKPSRMVAYTAFALYVFLVALFLALGCIPETFTLLDFKAWIVCLLSWLVCSLMAAILLPILSESLLVKHFSEVLTRRLLSYRWRLCISGLLDITAFSNSSHDRT